ncbi:hypothetical protein [Actinomycetospora sp. NBRC 106378]|uniref:hypothetical protein n=1 Tax=Actinomycetospora sp. NBRC 106378 TaxID=3032208 RepID=UPI002552AAED|nr:hypothetical protein [Actinomycetospora sp. NBRC 106378]
MRAAVLAHTVAGTGTRWLVLAGLLGLACAGSTVWLGLVGTPGTLSFVLALWVGGQVTQAALAGGDPVLPPEMLALLPIRHRVLAAATLLIGLREPATLVTALALGALVVRGVAAGAVLVGLLAWVLTVLLTVVLAALAGALVAPARRRGRDLATMATALGLAVVALAGGALPFLLRALDGPGPLTTAVRGLPSGWGLLAVDAGGRPAAVALPLVGLALVTLAAAAALPAALERRLAGAAAPSRPGRGSRTRRRVLPGGPTGAVVGRELRLWLRDPLRLTCLVLAALVSVGAAAVAALTSTTALLPFVGVGWTVIAAACASNLSGFDGGSTWLTRLVPGWTTPDLRGRQIAWALLVAPPAVVAGVLGVWLSGDAWAWPWVVTLTPALLAGGAAVVGLGSTVAVLPLDATGGPTPAWAVKVHLALYVTALTAAPAATPVVVGVVLGVPGLCWTGVPVAAVVGAVLVVTTSCVATRRLRSREPAS